MALFSMFHLFTLWLNAWKVIHHSILQWDIHDKAWIIYQLHDAIWKSLQEWLEPLKIIYSSLNGLLTIFVITAQAIRLDSWKQAIGLAIGSSLGIVDISYIWDWSTIKRFYNKHISFHPHANNCIIFLQCKKTFLLYHCLCNYIRHSEVGGMDREPHSTWVGCLMGCLWDRTREMDRNKGEAPLSNKGCDVQWRDTMISVKTCQWSYWVGVLPKECLWDAHGNNMLVLSWFRIVSSPTCFQVWPLINLLVKC